MTTETSTPETNPAEIPNPCQRELTIEIPADVVKAETEKLIKPLHQGRAHPGFRKGKVPACVIRQRFAEDIKGEIVEHWCHDTSREEVQKQALSPVSQPRVTDLHFHEGEPLKFTAASRSSRVQGSHAYDDIKVETIDSTVS